MGFILRYLTCLVLAGDANAMDDRYLNGLREIYQALGNPGNIVACSIEKVKDAAVAIANDPMASLVEITAN